LAAGSLSFGSDGVGAAFAGTDADGVLDGNDEDLAVADAAGARGVLDRLDSLFFAGPTLYALRWLGWV